MLNPTANPRLNIYRCRVRVVGGTIVEVDAKAISKIEANGVAFRLVREQHNVQPRVLLSTEYIGRVPPPLTGRREHEAPEPLNPIIVLADERPFRPVSAPSQSAPRKLPRHSKMKNQPPPSSATPSSSSSAVPWKKLDGCRSCGAAAGARCKDGDDLADSACAGRQFVAGAVLDDADVGVVEAAGLSDGEALDRLARLLAAGVPDGHRAMTETLEEAARFVRLTGRLEH